MHLLRRYESLDTLGLNDILYSFNTEEVHLHVVEVVNIMASKSCNTIFPGTLDLTPTLLVDVSANISLIGVRHTNEAFNSVTIGYKLLPAGRCASNALKLLRKEVNIINAMFARFTQSGRLHGQVKACVEVNEITLDLIGRRQGWIIA